MDHLIFNNLGRFSSSAYTMHPLAIVGILVSISLAPFVVLSVTSFIKISVVLNILRNAIGGNQIPSVAVTSLISLVLTLYIMTPTARETWTILENTLTEQAINREKSAKRKKVEQEFAIVQKIAKSSVAPLEVFLRKHAGIKERLFFAQKLNEVRLPKSNKEKISCEIEQKGKEAGQCFVSGENLFTLIPAFVISEIRLAFGIGFIIFLPFLVIDLIVANILLALGMMMLSPQVISLPIKLLIFVLSDGWYLLCKSLILGYS